MTIERFEPCSDEEHSVPGFSSSVKWLLEPFVYEDLRGHACGAGVGNPDDERRFRIVLRSAQSIVRKAQLNNYDASASDIEEFDEHMTEMSEILGINVGAVLYHTAAGRNPYDYEDIYDL